MRAREFITEAKVKSSWIARLEYSGYPSRTLTMVLKNGRMYKIPGVSQTLYKQMMADPSKGKYYHKFIKDKYLVNRVGDYKPSPNLWTMGSNVLKKIQKFFGPRQNSGAGQV